MVTLRAIFRAFRADTRHVHFLILSQSCAVLGSLGQSWAVFRSLGQSCAVCRTA